MQDFNQLFSILQKATSQNSADVALATKALQDSEGVEGFHYALLKIALSSPQSIDLNVRWLAVLCLKNGIERHWRTHGLTPISENEKQTIKKEILSCLSENIQQVCVDGLFASAIAMPTFILGLPMIPCQTSSSQAVHKHKPLC